LGDGLGEVIAVFLGHLDQLDIASSLIYSTSPGPFLVIVASTFDGPLENFNQSRRKRRGSSGSHPTQPKDPPRVGIGQCG
jgi:hypothetical protein